MPKIGNWSKKNEDMWVHDYHPHVVIEVRNVRRYGRESGVLRRGVRSRKTFEVLLFKGVYADTGRPVASAGTQAEARREAVQFMRNHPWALAPEASRRPENPLVVCDKCGQKFLPIQADREYVDASFGVPYGNRTVRKPEREPLGWNCPYCNGMHRV